MALDIMRRVELFRGLNEAQLESLSKICNEEVYSRGSTICREGDPGDKMYVISTGQVEIVVKDDQGKSHAAVYLGSGQVVGEMSLIDEGKRSATVVAAEDETVVYGIPHADFTQLCQKDTAIGYIMMRNLAQDLSFKVRHSNVAPSAN